jgi:hypothetical protein
MLSTPSVWQVVIALLVSLTVTMAQGTDQVSNKIVFAVGMWVFLHLCSSNNGALPHPTVALGNINTGAK